MVLTEEGEEAKELLEWTVYICPRGQSLGWGMRKEEGRYLPDTPREGAWEDTHVVGPFAWE